MKLQASVALLLAALGLAGSLAATPAGGDKLLFVSNRDGNAQIYLINADGSGERACTASQEENTEPAWSPDGRRVAFTSYRDGNAEIYVMDADGAHQRRLTSDPMADTAPAWLADGRIVLRSMRGGWANFYTVDADGSQLRPLTNTASDKGAPVPSPDGRWIAYVAHGDKGQTDIHVLPASGGEDRNLTAATPGNQKLSPSWSPDSQRLVYGEYGNGALNLRVIGLDGAAPVKLTDNAFSNASATWSPDGKRIAFVSSREGSRMDMARGEIYVMNADGSAAVNLTQHPAEDNYPAWSADGRWIYFVSLREGHAQIYAIAEQGGQARRLTHNQGYDLMIRPQQAAARAAAAGNAALSSSLH